MAPRSQRGPGSSARLWTGPAELPPPRTRRLQPRLRPPQTGPPSAPAGFCVSMLPRVTSRPQGLGRVQGSPWAGADSGVSVDHGSPQVAEAVPSLGRDAGPSSQEDFTGPESAWAPSPVQGCWSSAQASPVGAVGRQWCPGPCLGMRTAQRPSPPAQPDHPAPPALCGAPLLPPGCRPPPGWKRQGAQLWAPWVPTRLDSPQGIPLSALQVGPQHPAVSLLRARPRGLLTDLGLLHCGAPRRDG